MSFAPKITPADAHVDWKLPAHMVDRQIRACTPDPGAWTELDGVRLKIGPVSLDPGQAGSRLRRTSRPASCRPAAMRCSSAPAPVRYASATSRPRASAG